MKVLRFAGVLILAAAGVRAATDFTWLSNSGTNSFADGSNWTPTGVPGSSDNAKFTTAGTYGISFESPVTNASATVGAPGGVDATFALSGGSWVLSGALSFSGSGIARFGGGALEVGSTTTVGSSQKLILNAETSWFQNTLKTTSGGTVEVDEGDHTLTRNFELNAAPSGGSSFRMTGGSLSLTNAAEGSRLTFNEGSKMSLEGGTLSVRYITDMYGTRANPCVLDIYTNATYNNRYFGINISRSGGGLALMNVRGGSFLSSNGTLQVIHTQWAPSPLVTTGIVNLADGRIYAGSISLGSWSNSVAILNQSGGSLQVPGTFSIGSFSNTAAFYRQDGGTSWINLFHVGNAMTATGEVNLAGGVFAANDALCALGKMADSCGRFRQTGGTLILSNAVSVGVGARSVGLYTNTGGSAWINGTLYLGNSGSALAGALGRACFAGPSNVLNSGIVLGNSGADTGELAVEGGSLVIAGGNVTVGNAGKGRMAVTGGTLAMSGNTVVGNVLGSEGTLEISGGSNYLKNVTIGHSGTGSASISGGMQLATNSALVVGNNGGSSGTLEISGGTNLFNNMTFGQAGTALVKITGGYSWTTNRLVVGSSAGSTGRVELTGGILAVSTIDGRDPTLPTNPGGMSEMIFDGGTLQHTWYLPDFKEVMVSGFGKALLTDRGAVFDTAGGARTILQTLSNEVGHAGSLTKKGEGLLRLSAYNGFTGRVTVEKGDLTVTAGGTIYLTGGMVIDAGAILNLTTASAIHDSTTAPGTVSRIDGALCLKSGVVLTNGVGASLGGSGVVTGSVVFASGSVYGRDKATDTGALRVTGSTVFQTAVAVALTGYTPQELEAGIPLITSGTLQVPGKMPVMLNGMSHPYWWASVSADGKTLAARVIRAGTIISLR